MNEECSKKNGIAVSGNEECSKQSWIACLTSWDCWSKNGTAIVIVLTTVALLFILLAQTFSWKASLPVSGLGALLTFFLKRLYDFYKQKIDLAHESMIQQREFEEERRIQQKELAHESITQQREFEEKRRTQQKELAHESMIQQKEFAEERMIQQKEFANKSIRQQREFTNTLNLNKKGPMVEEVMKELHKYAFDSEKMGQEKLQEKIKDISLLLNKVLIYFQKEDLIEKITEGLAIGLLNRKMTEVHKCMQEIREGFSRALYPKSDESSFEIEGKKISMEKYLSKIYKAFLCAGKDCRAFPIEVQTDGTKPEELEKQWIDVRYSRGPIEIKKLNLASGTGKDNHTDLSGLDEGDLLIFWAQKDDHAETPDGVIGIMSVLKKVDDSTIILGRRESAELKNPIRFSEMENKKFADLLHGNKPIDLFVKEGDNQEGDNSTAQKDLYNYMLSLFDTWEKLKARYSFDLKKVGIPVKIDQYSKSYSSRIMIDFDLYGREPMVRAWLHSFFRWFREEQEIAFQFRGIDLFVQEFKVYTAWNKTSDMFRDITSEGNADTSGHASETELGRAHTEILLSALDEFPNDKGNAYFVLQSTDPPRFELKEVGIKKCKCGVNLRLSKLVIDDQLICAKCNKKMANEEEIEEIEA